jgi:hypothetical protein
MIVGRAIVSIENPRYGSRYSAANCNLRLDYERAFIDSSREPRAEPLRWSGAQCEGSQSSSFPAASLRCLRLGSCTLTWNANSNFSTHFAGN